MNAHIRYKISIASPKKYIHEISPRVTKVYVQQKIRSKSRVATSIIESGGVDSETFKPTARLDPRSTHSHLRVQILLLAQSLL